MQTEAVCSICGKVPEPAETFCANCGHNLTPAFTAAPHSCPRCNSPVAPEDQVCAVCGQTFESNVRQPEPPTLADSRTCLHCGARVEGNEHSCKVAAAATGFLPRSEQVHAPPASATVKKSSSVTVVKILLGVLLAMSLFIGFVAVVALAMLGSYASVTDPTRSGVASTFLTVSAFFFGLSLAMLFPRFYLVYLFPSIALVVAGIFWPRDVFGMAQGFDLPDRILSSGVANFIGGGIGFVISKIARHLQKEGSRPS